ncbi:PfkB family carbohydrate kinase [Aureimonas psammosilenae]|uniref:PfkB family carbohydrate kinase n=1 Tax=Aureimonas psammosilenae TaxID=2495496 RepID=UPI0012606029|nr:PfkB family carbohydrate kinase [Aureimonas psammosilenae]
MVNARSLERSPRFFVAGAAHMDRRGRSDGAFALGASNPGRFIETPGGAMLNAVRALRRLDAPVRFVSARGGDRDGIAVTDMLAELGVEDLAMTWLDRQTPTYTALLDDRGDLVGGLADMKLYDLMQPRVFRRRHLREALAESDALMLDANLPATAIETLAKAAGERPVTAIAVSPAKVGRLRNALPRLAAVFMSRAEAASLCGMDGAAPVEALVGSLRELGCRRAAITDGAGAAAIFDGSALTLQAPPPVRSVHDVTGAGDTLAAVASLALARGASFAEAVRHGMAAASLHISTRLGENGASLEEIERLAATMPAPALSIPETTDENS